MDPKQLVKTLELLEKRTEKIQEDVIQVKLDIAANKEVADMKAKIAALEVDVKAKLAASEVKLYIFGSVLFLILTGLVGYFFKTHG